MNVFTYGFEVQTTMAGKRRCHKTLAPTHTRELRPPLDISWEVLMPFVWLTARSSPRTVESHVDGVRYVSKLANLS